MATETLGQLLTRNAHGDNPLDGSEGLMLWDDETKGITVSNFVGNLPIIEGVTRLTLTGTGVDLNTASWTAIPWTGAPITNDLYTVALPAVTVNEAGTYRCYCNIQYTGAVQRQSVALRFSVNGVGQEFVSRSGYVRLGSGHNRASTNLMDVLELSAGDVIRAETIRDANSGAVSSLPCHFTIEALPHA